MADIYPFQLIEDRWQKAWQDSNVQLSRENPGEKKYYILEMLPYPSGRLHMGHVRNYSIGDAIARYKKMCGYNILHPIGWDAFGLPAENAAIKNRIHPVTWTLDNIASMKKQMKRLGFHYDWSREVTTCLPEFYRWNQWFFLQMYERGLVYKKYGSVNWCNVCQTVLANEQVINGVCWRDDSPIVQKKLEQWFIRITDYAEELLREIDNLPQWPDRVKIMQRNWLGKSRGANVLFPIQGMDERIEIFTTRIDTIYGANAIILSPEHPLVDPLLAGRPNESALRESIQEIIRKTKIDRSFADTTKEGLFLGRHAVNPFSGELLPIWVGNFILMEYGTGAIMAVPGHDARDREFSLKYDLPIRPVIRPVEGESGADELFEDYGILINSGPYDGLTSEGAMEQMARHAEENGFGKATTTFKMRDWGVSRQRYWGTPIPIVYCDGCGMVPVPYDELPVLLPNMDKIDYHGGSPLTNIPDFVHTQCPRCGGPARRDTDTMDTFVDSSWYFLRYTDAKVDDRPVDSAKIGYWFPVDIYIGGIEHAVGHLIFMRFWWKMMRDIGLVSGAEPVNRLLTQGMVIKDGAKMSKSLGNIVDPDALIEKFGADTIRLFILFASPPEKDLDWSDQGIEGCFRFLNRVWRLVEKNTWLKQPDTAMLPLELADRQRHLLQKAHQTIQKVSSDIEERLQFNTAIAACMELTNELYAADNAGLENKADKAAFKFSLESLVWLLSPFAPHIAEEIWNRLGHDRMVIESPWPVPDPRFLASKSIEIPVMVNGKLRTRFEIPVNEAEEVVKSTVLGLPKVRELLEQKQLKKYFYVKNKIVNLVIQ